MEAVKKTTQAAHDSEFDVFRTMLEPGVVLHTHSTWGTGRNEPPLSKNILPDLLVLCFVLYC